MMRRQISIPDEINKHLSKLPNASGYIAQLVEADLKNKPVTRDEVLRIIDERLNGKTGEDQEVIESLKGFF
jgi:hypothetical protein